MKRELTKCSECGDNMKPRRKSLICSKCSRKSLKATARLLLVDEGREDVKY